ncbi:NAD-glutamate dehydrogenase [Aestuariimicrobium sp. T2.26MG-19.2B]|uniref:NAD-glutamate dehydrogenase n=1 Tax=Aestuariimicrobium sp. T2.26MG-19.2B TaxID=3040679 RepID=UPI002477AA2D|nr:NAD-glutamate dehydrogenase [Aestuariimicrobium sp. T2.26MG-19.2B]CAI9410829.1 NAD-specific glutamate dehydrogenase [Aestuariimicrobium sp. T2.26MG-19.2B]
MVQTHPLPTTRDLRETWVEGCLAYDHHSDDRSTLEALGGAQVDLAAGRRPGEDRVRVARPDAGVDVGAAWLVQVIGDDGPFRVDSVAMALTELGWAIRDLYHPTLPVTHGDTTIVESWVAVLAAPPLGVDSDEAAGRLQERLETAFEHLAVAVADWGAMADRARDISAGMRGGDTETEAFADTLDWFAEVGFFFLGARDHEVVDGQFRTVPGSGLGVLRDGEPMAFHATVATSDPRPWLITKDSTRSLVHRSGLRDYIAVRTFDEDGHLVAERCLVGMLASKAYSEDLARIPMLRDKLDQVLSLLGADPLSHRGKAVIAAMSTHPRDEVFQSRPEQLAELVGEVAELRERRQVRAFVRADPWGRFAYITVFLPRDRYNTQVREAMQDVLRRHTGATAIDFRTQVSESALARLFFTLTLPGAVDWDLTALQSDLTRSSLDWTDGFFEQAKALPSSQRGVEFSAAYMDHNSPAQGVFDLAELNSLRDDDDMRLVMYRPDQAERADLRVKVFVGGPPMTLSHAMPLWNSLGLTIVDERAYPVDLRGRTMSIADFGLVNPAGVRWDVPDRQRVLDAFEACHRGAMDVDQLNALVATSGLTWRQVVVVRTISRYLMQAGISYSQSYISQTLLDHPAITRALVELFDAKFDPTVFVDGFDRRTREVDALSRALGRELDEVTSLDADRILRSFLQVIEATVRTNAFQPQARATALKLVPERLSLLPKPRPAFEIFVHSPRVEGVHLRFGSVARGGLRWSDRPEDFRTEVLGLVKAQMVKNTVIVPVGAKGGFLPRRLPSATDRAAWLAEGEECYRIFIGSLLDVTDNLVAGEVVHPEHVVRHDADDTYLVVAADKGTAAFSDLANQIALERGFWLGDAFASGGSKGYDHKAMGITARGAWESVKRHLAELGIDSQAQDFSCVGIGDMAGDVFGNGMLLSEHIRLVAAFNHQHIFLDPTPDAAAGFAERQRLFHLPRSSWDDYDPSAISTGGGVHSRQAKAIAVTPEVCELLDLDAAITSLTPTELIHAILQAPVDLLFNGGIGTYVKAESESHADVGDRANDAVRVNGSELRCRAIGEGGNLGLTQKGRIEYARGGGRVNTDFIDNSAGVDTSDHEVNIKILLSDAVEAGRLDPAGRDELLPTMTDEIADLVLIHNIDQNVALANARSRAAAMSWVHESLIQHLESAVGLDRQLEGLPDQAAMQAIVERGEALSNPELCTLMAWSKIWLERVVLESDLPDDPYLQHRLHTYFPMRLREQFGDLFDRHALRREIITTVAVNRFVNSQGISACHRLATETGRTPDEVIRAQLVARSVFGAGRYEAALVLTGMDPTLQLDLRLSVRKLVERGTRWLLMHRRSTLDIAAEIELLTPRVERVARALPDLLTARSRGLRDQALEGYLRQGVDRGLAETAAEAKYLHLALAMIEVSRRDGHDLELTAATFVEMVERLGLDNLLPLIEGLPRSSEWDVQARSAMRDELLQLQTDLTAQALQVGSGRETASEVVQAWGERVPQLERRLEQLKQAATGGSDLPRLSVALRLVRGMFDAVNVG